MDWKAMSELAPAIERSIDGRPYEDLNKLEKRALWEAFEFTLLSPGIVRVENVSYGDESKNHRYGVAATRSKVIGCTCTFAKRADTCKHQIAVENEPAVFRAITASPEEFERARESEGDSAITESGVGSQSSGDGDRDTPSWSYCPRCGRSLPSSDRTVLRCSVCSLLLTTKKRPKDVRDADAEPVTDIEAEIDRALAELH